MYFCKVNWNGRNKSCKYEWVKFGEISRCIESVIEYFDR